MFYSLLDVLFISSPPEAKIRSLQSDLDAAVGKLKLAAVETEGFKSELQVAKNEAKKKEELLKVSSGNKREALWMQRETVFIIN